MMLLFCMTIMFSVSCPLITPFGTLYFVTKHYVDRHNLVSARGDQKYIWEKRPKCSKYTKY
jgi:hypothetical protein